MTEHLRAPWLVRTTQRIEADSGLDAYVDRLRPLAERLIAAPQRREILHGHPIGHAVHPLLTDVPLGFWTSAVVLDLLGPKTARGAARRLVGLGVLSAVPTAVTGVAEWAAIERREQRVGVVHAAANSAALTCYLSSYLARRRGRHGVGVLLGLAGGVAATVGGYLGGHLTEVRKVSSRHPVFEDDAADPRGDRSAPVGAGNVPG